MSEYAWKNIVYVRKCKFLLSLDDKIMGDVYFSYFHNEQIIYEKNIKCIRFSLPTAVILGGKAITSPTEAPTHTPRG